jgi:hypothetical protein
MSQESVDSGFDDMIREHNKRLDWEDDVINERVEDDFE